MLVYYDGFVGGRCFIAEFKHSAVSFQLYNYGNHGYTDDIFGGCLF